MCGLHESITQKEQIKQTRLQRDRRVKESSMAKKYKLEKAE
jgi:hypothetical protein